MKKKNLIFVIAMIIAITYSWNKAFSQATSICTTCPVIGAPNTSPNAATDYLGWAAGVNQPLNIGNYDPQLINFFTNSNPSGQIDPTLTNNTSFGYLTFGSLTSGFANSLFGSNAGFSITSGYRNSFFGDSAGYLTQDGYSNTFVGYIAGFTNVSGRKNTFVGDSCGYSSNTTGNSFLGYCSGRLTTGIWNTFMGEHSGELSTSGVFNAFYGKDAGFNNGTNRDNTYIGTHSGYDYDGQYNTIVGCMDPVSVGNAGSYNAFFGMNTDVQNQGSYNTFLGSLAGGALITGDYNTCVGYGTQAYDGLANSAAIGANAIVRKPQQMILGDNNVQNVGIGYSNNATLPQGLLSVNQAGNRGTGSQMTGINVDISGTSTSTGTGIDVKMPGTQNGNATGESINVSGNITGAGNTSAVGLTATVNPASMTGTSTVTGIQGIAGGQGNQAAVYGMDYNAYGGGAGNTTVGVYGINCSVDQGENIYGLWQDLGNGGYITGIKENLYATADHEATAFDAEFTGQVNGDATGVNINMTGTLGVTGNTKGINVNLVGRFSENIIGVNDNVNPAVGVASPNTILGQNVSVTNPPGGNATTIGTVSKSVVTTNGTLLTNWGGTAIGVFGEGEHTNHGYDANCGVWGWTNGGDYQNYGVLGHAPVCNNCNGSNAAGFFDGDVWTSSNNYISSDSILKDSVQTLNNSMAIINQLNPKSYYFKVDSFPTVSLPTGIQYGLISQQVGRVLPGLVKTFVVPQPLDSLDNPDSTTAIVPILSLNYTGLIPFLVGGEQQLNQSIDSLRSDIGYGLVSTGLKTIPGDIGMHFNAHNILYSGQDSANSKIGIGYDSGTVSLPAKLNVNESSGTTSSHTFAGYIQNMDTTIQANGLGVEVDGSSVFDVGILTDIAGTVTLDAYGSMTVIDGDVGGNAVGDSITIDGIVGGDAKGVDIEMPEDLNVTGDAIGVSISLQETASGSAIGIGADVNGSDLGASGIGVLTHAMGAPLLNRGGWCMGFGGTTATGLLAVGGSSDFENYGIIATTDGTGSDINYGIYASGPSGGDSATASTNAAAYINGDIVYTGNVYSSSDAKLKTNVTPIENALATINMLKPKSYTFRTKDYPGINLAKGENYGLIAEDVEQVLPSLVKNFKAPLPMDSIGNFITTAQRLDFMSIDYQQIMPFLIKGIQEQQQTIDSLNDQAAQQQTTNQNFQNGLDSMRSQLAQLQLMVNNCCASNQRKSNASDTSSINVNLNNTGAIILNQNDPNPFAENTTISFNIPSSVGEAKIIFFDNLGRIINTVIINDRGPGKLDVYASNLSSGIYSYSLLADGKLIDTKKMVCNK